MDLGEVVPQDRSEAVKWFSRAADHQTAKITTARADLRAGIDGGAATLRPLLQTLAEKATPTTLDDDTNTKAKPPTLVISIDQGEELFFVEGQDEARAFLTLLRDLLCQDVPLLFTIRSDAYEPLQLARELHGVPQEMVNLPPMPKGSYAEVIKGPARRILGTVSFIAPIAEPARSGSRGWRNEPRVDVLEVLIDLADPGPLPWE